MSKKRKEEKQRASTRQLIGVKEISDFSIVTYEHGELVFFLIKPYRCCRRRALKRECMRL